MIVVGDCIILRLCLVVKYYVEFSFKYVNVELEFFLFFMIL